MTLDVVYVTRHGFRSNWLVDPSTGNYTATLRTPTGIAADPSLTAHGVDQSKELAAHLETVDPPIEAVYSSPYFRCLQTVDPFVTVRRGQTAESPSRPRPGPAHDGLRVRGEPGLCEWYGSAPFEHPTPARRERLKELFPALDMTYEAAIIPSPKGESIAQLHDRVAAAMDAIVDQCDREGRRAILICSHAAVIIALGRVLTGSMPDLVETEDFSCFTCGLSTFRRKRRAAGSRVTGPGVPGSPGQGQEAEVAEVAEVAENAGSTPPEHLENQHARPMREGVGSRAGLDANNHTDLQAMRNGHPVQSPNWRNGRGIRGGWVCDLNSDCSFLSNGEERGWRFSGDESFGKMSDGAQSQLDAGIELGVVVESRRRHRHLSDHRL